MMRFGEKIEAGMAVRKNRKPGVVISINSRSPRQERMPVNGNNPVTQGRLAEGFRLHHEEMRIMQALREFRLQLGRDLAAGSEIEGGDLTYDSELKIVRRNITNGTGP